MIDVRNWIEESPYTHALGLHVDEFDEHRVRLVLPYKDENANPGKALHGGVAASLGAIGGQAVARAALSADSGPWHTAQLQVNYLSAAIGEDIVAEAKLLRGGKAMCFVEIEIETTSGKAIAEMTSVVRGRFGAPPVATLPTAADDGASDPGAMGPHVEKLPFMVGRGIQIENMSGSASRIVMPWLDDNADASGIVHEGAVMALLDTTGAMAAWAETGPGPYKASTASMQIQCLAPMPRADVVAYGRCVQRDHEMFWSDAEVANAETGQVVARGTVLYRILT